VKDGAYRLPEEPDLSKLVDLEAVKRFRL
jgi:hypothetical protein